MGWLPSRNRESETSPSGFMGQTDVNSSRKYSGREWKRNRLSRAVATRYYQREIGIGREEERDVITLSRYRVSPLRTIRTKRIISFSLFPSFHLLHAENNDPLCFNCSQPGVLFDSMRWTNTWIDRGGIWPQRRFGKVHVSSKNRTEQRAITGQPRSFATV